MSNRKQKILEKKISEIMIVNNKKLAPYIKAVNFSSRNIDQRKLGTVLGVFEIKDTSEDSAYIVNFLASVTKKTYFANHHKNALESFEATLYRLNLSLSEVAKHGNVNWIGKIDAVLCAIDENEIHFSVSGDAKVLLLRNGQLTNISSGLSPQDEAINPIKTFTDIASGRLEDMDKIIVTTDDISHVFTLENLEKHSLSFTGEEFIRFLKTALINELDIAGTIVIDINEKILELKKEEPIAKKDFKKDDELIGQSINAFSNKTFEEVTKNKQITTIEEITESDEVKDEDEYTHTKTGHIYIKDTTEEYTPTPKNNIEKITLDCKEGFFSFCFWIKDRYLQKGSYQLKKRLSPRISSTKEKIKHLFSITILGNIFGFFKSIGLFLSNTFITVRNTVKKIIPEKSQEIDVEIRNSLSENKSNKFEKIKDAVSKILPGKGNVSGVSAPKIEYPKVTSEIEYIKRKPKVSFSFLKKISPSFKKIKQSFSKMDKRHKLYVLGVIAFILIAPIIFIKIQDKRNAIITEVNEEKNHQETMAVNPSSDYYTDAEKIYFGENIIGSLKFGEDVFIIAKNNIIKLNNNGLTEYSLPDYAKNIKNFSFMNDLNLIFLLTDNNKITSFSPISKNFDENNINVPENAKIDAMGTYLTYLYLVDSNNNQIYRYPRAEGGFGERISWLKDNINLENITSMAIDENIYLMQKGDAVKLSKGRKEDFNLADNEGTSIEKIFTTDKLEFIYAIDKQNGELIKFRKDGSRDSHYSNQELLRSNNFWVDGDSEMSHFSTENEIFKIKTP